MRGKSTTGTTYHTMLLFFFPVYIKIYYTKNFVYSSLRQVVLLHRYVFRILRKYIILSKYHNKNSISTHLNYYCHPPRSTTSLFPNNHHPFYVSHHHAVVFFTTQISNDGRIHYHRSLCLFSFLWCFFLFFFLYMAHVTRRSIN